MSNLTKLEFEALDISGKNYLSWILDAEIHLDAKGLGNAILPENDVSNQDKAKAMIFLRHHIHEGLKAEYLTVKDPLELWNALKERFDHQKTVILPKARYDWMHLRLQDFKTVSEYNSAVFKISSQLKLCGEKITEEDLLEKTFSTFHASNMILQQQYREKGFKKYSELISCLLVAEQNNELLMKNHEIRPTGSAPIPEINAAMHNNYGRGRSRGRGRGRGKGHKNSHYRGGCNINHDNLKKRNNEKGHKNDFSTTKAPESKCHRCGMKGHWARACRTSAHLVKLYQASLKKSDNNAEVNMMYQDNDIEANCALKDDLTCFDGLEDIKGLDGMTHLDVEDFFNDN